MYIRQCICFVLLAISVYLTAAKPRDGSCADCVHYNFEAGLQSFSSKDGACDGFNTWTEGTYSNVEIELPNEFTQSFISPQADLSCTASFPFSMSSGGTVSVKIYIDSWDSSYPDQVYVLAQQISTTGENPTMGVGSRSSSDSNFVKGWNTMSFTLWSSNAFEGQLTFMGQSNENSTVLVDSFCYKPASYDGDCWGDSVVAPPETEETEPDSVEEEEEANTPATEVTSTPEIATVVPEVTSTPEIATVIVPEVTSTSEIATVIVPEPTIPTPAPGSNKCPVDPSVHWLLPHEYDCNLFYYCVWGEKVLRHCAAGLHFNPIIQVCDWPWDAGCSSQ